MAAFRKINKPIFCQQLLTKRSISSYHNFQAAKNIKKSTVIFGGFGLAYLFFKKCQNFVNPLFSPVLAKEREERREEKRLAMQTARELRYLSFASIEYQGNVYMTPQDFLESVTEEQPRPRSGRRRLSDDQARQLLRFTPRRGRGTAKMFRDMDCNGLISYTEYLFLLCVLTKPQSGFRIAFNMFDTDGNQRVDKKEFLVMVQIMDKTLQSTKDEIKATDSIPGVGSRGNLWEILEDRLEEILTQQQRNQILDGSLPQHDRSQAKPDMCDTTLSLYFFGSRGTDTLKYEDFHRFMDNLQTEVLELEFNEFSRGMANISEEEFAKILLRYTTLSAEETEEYLVRLRQRVPDVKGITFQEFKDFGMFLNSIDDFSLAMKMYSYLGQPISQDDFMRATLAVTGTRLSGHLTHVVFQLFDKDGDGHLSQDEFISVMKDRIQRGFKSQVVLNSQWDMFKACIKQEMKNC